MPKRYRLLVLAIFALLSALAFSLFLFERGPDDTVEYASVAHRGARCIGVLSRGGGAGGDQGELDFGPHPPDGLERRLTRPLSELQVLRASELEGRAVSDQGTAWRIARVFAKPGGGNTMLLEGPSGEIKPAQPRGTCLLDLE